MKNTKTIEMARKFLNNGNGRSYAQLISASIRSAMSARTANMFRAVIAEDKTAELFRDLGTDCPLAA